MMPWRLVAVTILIGSALGACAPGSPASGGGSASAGGARAETDSARLARLEREARGLARTEGCARSEQCRVAPLGHRACGGPRDYLPYCALSTDSAALFTKLGELARAEEEYQHATGAVSTCEMRLPPVVGASRGQCTSSPADER